MTAVDPLVARIEFAFADVSRPADDDLAALDAPNEDAVQALVGVESWQTLPDETIEQSPGALSQLAPEGFRHFLPAYMRWVVRHGAETPDAPVVRSTFQALTPKGGVDAPPSPRFSLLDAEHSSCIASFLDRMATHPEAQEARAYWRMRAGYLPSAGAAETETEL